MLTIRRATTFTITLALTLAVSACSSSSTTSTGDGGGGGGSDPTVSTADCTSQCQTKATMCGASAATGQSQCASICMGSLTQSQLTCFSSSACSALATVKDAASLNGACPKGSSGSDAGGGTTGDDAGTTCGLNGTGERWSCKCATDTETVCVLPGKKVCDVACFGTNNTCDEKKCAVGGTPPQ